MHLRTFLMCQAEQLQSLACIHPFVFEDVSYRISYFGKENVELSIRTNFEQNRFSCAIVFEAKVKTNSFDPLNE